MRAVVLTGAGGNEVVQVAERPDPEPGSEELLVRVAYAGLNPADLLQRAGRYPAPPGSPADVPGLEVAGVVEAVGAQVRRFRPGDRVLGLVGGGGLADRVVVHEACVAPTPDALDERQAAAVPEAYITAHDAIRTRCRLAVGEALLVQGANGGVGAAAVQIGVCAGARVLGVVRSDDGAAFVRGLGAEPLLADGWQDAAREATGGRGVDVVLELVGAGNLPGDLAVLAERGRIVVVGTGAGAKVELSLRDLMGRRAELHGTVLRARRLEDKAQALRAFEREVLPHLASGRIAPPIDTVLPAADVHAALDRLAASGKRGKVLIAW